MRTSMMSLQLALVTLATLPERALAQERGPATKEEMTAYIRKLDTFTKTIHEAGRDWGGLLFMAVGSGAPADVQASNVKCRKFFKIVGEAHADFQNLKVPDYAQVRSLQLAYEKYLVFQMQVVLRKVPDILDILDDKAILAEDKKTKVLDVLTKGAEGETKLLLEVNKIRTALVKEFNLTLP